jgi:hypothetical protein
MESSKSCMGKHTGPSCNPSPFHSRRDDLQRHLIGVHCSAIGSLDGRRKDKDICRNVALGERRTSGILAALGGGWMLGCCATEASRQVVFDLRSACIKYCEPGFCTARASGHFFGNRLRRYPLHRSISFTICTTLLRLGPRVTGRTIPSWELRSAFDPKRTYTI